MSLQCLTFLLNLPTQWNHSLPHHPKQTLALLNRIEKNLLKPIPPEGQYVHLPFKASIRRGLMCAGHTLKSYVQRYE